MSTTTSITVRETPLVLFALRRADDALVLGHRLSEWCGHAPTIEEDLALANIGLDLLGQARNLCGRQALFGQDAVACPRCATPDTERLAEFASTSCKALWRCRACREPFGYFKCH